MRAVPSRALKRVFDVTGGDYFQTYSFDRRLLQNHTCTVLEMPSSNLACEPLLSK